MATIIEPCPWCAAETLAHIGQSCQSGQLVWWASFHCQECAQQTELDGWDDLPEHWRAALLAQEGVWALLLTRSTDALRAAVVLRQKMGWGVAEALHKMKTTPCHSLTGTQGEMAFLAHLLQKRGIAAELMRLEKQHLLSD